MQSDNVVLYSIKNISPIFYSVKAEKEELKMSPSVQCLSVMMPIMFLSADSDRDEPPSMLCKSASRDGVNSFWNCSIQFRSGWDAT